MELFERIVALRAAGERFAVATVVSRQAPVSSQLGDRAIILADGRLEGFIGGACSREIVRQQALEALALGRARLVRISPEPLAQRARPDEICVAMRCASEGALDVYIEPQLAKHPFLIVGGSPIAAALAEQAALQGYAVTLACEADEQPLLPPSAALLELGQLSSYLTQLSEAQRGGLVAVVASMGHYDELALQQLAPLPLSYLGLVASRKRGEAVKQLLRASGVSEGALARLRTPAGLDIGAKTAPEVALSILAELVQLRRSTTGQPEVTSAIDPVCGTAVAPANAKYRAEHGGKTYYFCCPNCRHHFLKDPDKYLRAPA